MARKLRKKKNLMTFCKYKLCNKTFKLILTIACSSKHKSNDLHFNNESRFYLDFPD